MKNKNILQIALLIVVCVLLIFNLFFKGSGNYRESKKEIKDIQEKLIASSKIVEKQNIEIEELRKQNKELGERVNKNDSINAVIKKNMDAGFTRASRSINEIKKTVDDIKPLVIH